MVEQTWYKADEFKMPLEGDSIGVSEGLDLEGGVREGSLKAFILCNRMESEVLPL